MSEPTTAAVLTGAFYRKFPGFLPPGGEHFAESAGTTEQEVVPMKNLNVYEASIDLIREVQALERKLYGKRPTRADVVNNALLELRNGLWAQSEEGEG